MFSLLPTLVLKTEVAQQHTLFFLSMNIAPIHIDAQWYLSLILREWRPAHAKYHIVRSEKIGRLPNLKSFFVKSFRLSLIAWMKGL